MCARVCGSDLFLRWILAFAMTSLDARTGLQTGASAMFRPSLEKLTLIHRARHLGAGESDSLLIQAEGLLVAPELEDGVGAP